MGVCLRSPTTISDMLENGYGYLWWVNARCFHSIFEGLIFQVTPNDRQIMLSLLRLIAGFRRPSDPVEPLGRQMNGVSCAR